MFGEVNDDRPVGFPHAQMAWGRERALCVNVNLLTTFFHFDCPSGQLESCLPALQAHGTLGKVRCTVPQARDVPVHLLDAKANFHPAETVRYLANT